MSAMIRWPSTCRNQTVHEPHPWVYHGPGADYTGRVLHCAGSFLDAEGGDES